MPAGGRRSEAGGAISSSSALHAETGATCFRGGVTPCAARSAARAGLETGVPRPGCDLSLVGFEPRLETPVSGWGYDVRGCGAPRVPTGGPAFQAGGATPPIWRLVVLCVRVIGVSR